MLQTSRQPRLTYEDGLGKIKMPKFLRKVGAVVAGATGGVIGLKPKVLGVKSKSGKKLFRVGRVIGAVTGAVALAVVAGPAVLAKMGPHMAKFGTALKSFAPKALTKLGPAAATHAMKTLTDKGIPQDEAARMIEAEAEMMIEAETAAQAASIAQARGINQTAQAGMGGAMPMMLMGGTVLLVGFTFMQGRR